MSDKRPNNKDLPRRDTMDYRDRLMAEMEKMTPEQRKDVRHFLGATSKDAEALPKLHRNN